MTNYIDEMMKTAGVKGKWIKYETETTDGCINLGSKLTYPDFTAEKQLEIIQLIVNKCNTLDIFKGFSKDSDFRIGAIENWSEYKYNGCNPDFTQALAQLTTELMNSGELDKKKVKEILEQ